MPPTRLRSVPMVAPQSSPQQSGWWWDGSNWTCGDCDQPPTPPPCPPSGFPTPCPPWFPPPAGQAPWYPGANGGVSFSASPPANPIRGNFWWDGVMLHLFDGAAWVNIGPGAAGGGGAFVGTSPPSNPAQGVLWWNGTGMQLWNGTTWVPAWPLAVTDGSVASPGFIGEVIHQVTNGSVSVIPPPGAPATTFAALMVPPGDWNIQGTVSIHDMTTGCYWDFITFNILNGATTIGTYQIAANFTATAGGLIGGTYSGALIPLSVSAATTISASLQVIGVSGGTSGSGGYTFTAQARRMR